MPGGVAFEEEPEDDDAGEEGVEDGDDAQLDEGAGGAYRMNCRMYENEFPEIDDCVMVQVRSIAEMGAYVALLEYNNIEGMILLSELTRRRIRSVNKLIRVGKQEVCMVLRGRQGEGLHRPFEATRLCGGRAEVRRALPALEGRALHCAACVGGAAHRDGGSLPPDSVATL